MGTNNKREWNDLPEDLLELILSRLRNRDQRFFGQVCRSWRQVILRIKSRSGSSSLFRSSWLIAYENDGSHRCYFHDLLNSKHCIREFPELHGTVCLGSRYGWSLMCSGTSRFFFFNFFTEQRISLPKRKSKERLRFEIFSSFSKKNRPFVSGFSNPNSADWMVVIIRKIDSYKIEISRYLRGEKGWSTRICGIPTPGQTGKISGALVQKDIIYCFVEYKGNLRTWVFDAVELRLARIDYNLKSNLSKTQKHSVDGKRVLVFTPKFADLREKFLMRNPSLENWSASRRNGYDADEYPHRYVSLCPFVLTHPPLELASFSQSNPSSCFWTYRCVSAPDYSRKVKASNCHYLETIGGGCPDGNLCHETCRPCYVGVGLILTYCVAPGGGINYWRCRCSFMKGAPCHLPGIACPAPVSSSSSQSQRLLQDGYGNKTA